MLKKFIYIFLILPTVPFAQINESDSLKVKADLSVTGFWQGGNVETLIFRAKSGVTYKPWKKWVVKTQNSYVYQEFGREKADADILSLNFLYFNPEKKIYPQILGFFSTNFRREINSRSLLGAGVTWQAYKKDKDWLKFSLTSEYEQTNFNNTNFNLNEYDGSDEINTFRATVWVNGKYYMFKDKVILSHESYIQPSLEESNNYRWRADFGLEFPIWKFLNFKINYLHTFESIVVENQKREDKFLTFGLTLKSY
ncbi:DUF481 domain-containing protein [Winogradskyella flava]|uniref:DUF481 domain-containing protein n=1 Tax=Winogradskyella flava TaxID=1884876 RepID=A0A842ITM5_9FLAO|nr:DUF481 domain-containing protein [Winogradskyella flava]MBC2846261.1 DUF481 domain-containing protein [Winogradskyella flava]